MTTNRKGRAGCNQATLETAKRTRNFTRNAAPIKVVIVALALWGLVLVTDWLVTSGGLRDV